MCAPSAGHLGWRRRRCSVRSTNRQRRDSQGPVEKTTWELARGLIVPQQVEACCTPWCAVLVGGVGRGVSSVNNEPWTQRQP